MQEIGNAHEGEGRVALVTGGGRGIGKAIALGMAQVGYSVVVASTTQSRNEAAVKTIHAAGGRALAIELDVGEHRSGAVLARGQSLLVELRAALRPPS